jgi:hypothetical protein
MSDRFLAPSGAMAIVIAVILSTGVSSAGQARSAAPTVKKAAATATWTPPRTPDGRPDLQGVWLIRTATPLERPKALEGRQFLTAEEVVELRKRADRIFNTGNSDFAGGDTVFLTALANVEQYKNPNTTHGAEHMVEREFDNRTSLIVDPPDGRIPPLTPAAQQRQAAARAAAQRPPARAEELSNAHRCLSWSVPRLGGRYGAGDLAYYQILQTPGYVVLFMEAGDEARIIPLDGRPHLPAHLRQWKGDSRGRWEGDTLVIDTTNFSRHSNFMGSSDGLHLVERFTRVAADTIDYHMTISDETTWTRSWTALVPLKKTSARLYEFGCHEGNAEMIVGMLRAARADEKAAQEAAKKKTR